MIAMRAALAAPMIAVAVVAAAPAHGQNRIDRAFLSVEGAQRWYDDMPTMFDLAVEHDAVLQGKTRPVPKVALDRLRQWTAQAYDPAAMKAIVKAVAATKSMADAPGFVKAAERLRAAADAQKPVSPEQMEAQGKALEARYEARADKDAIDRLAKAMALPELAVEQAITLDRMLMMVGAGREPPRRAPTDAERAEMDQEIDKIVADSRRAPISGERGEYAYVTAREMGQASLRIALLDLDAADVRALLAFYDSPAGMARRKALLDGFAVANDAAARTLLTAMFRQMIADADALPKDAD